MTEEEKQGKKELNTIGRLWSFLIVCIIVAAILL